MLIRTSVLKLAAFGLFVSATVGSAVAQPVQFPVNGEFLRTSEVLGIPTSYCGHVIDLMMRNQHRRQNGGGFDGDVHLPHLSVGVAPGDLEMTGVHLVCDGDACRGPIFQVCMRNNSAIPIGNFRVSIVGVLGQIHVHAPTADFRVPRMEAGQELQIQLQLPVSCMAMGLPTQQAAFDTIVVAIDSQDDLIECDELNNIVILKRCDLVLLVPPSVLDVTVPGEVSPAQGPAQLAGPPSAAPQLIAPTTPENDGPSALDNIDVDQLDLGSADDMSAQLQ